MIFVVDMNLGPERVGFSVRNGFSARHRSEIGAADATDAAVVAWAARRRAVVFACDLDFSAILAASGKTVPSVVTLRTDDVLPEAIGERVVAELKRFRSELERDALITLDDRAARARLLPLRR